MVKARALGKGLGALIPPSPDRGSDKKGDGSTVLPLEDLVPNPAQPRQAMDTEALHSLAESIRAHGIVQPILVRKKDGDTYEIVAGERRWRAAKIAGLDEVPVRIFTGSDQAVREISLIENIQREDLSPLDVAAAISELIRVFDLTQEEIAGRIGWSRTAVTNKLRLLQLPDEVKRMLAENRLTEGHGRALLALDSPAAMTALARTAAERGLSVRQLEEAARSAKRDFTLVTRPGRIRYVVPTAVRQRAKSLGIGLRVTGEGDKMRLALDGLDRRQAELVFDLLQQETFAKGDDGKGSE